MVADEPPTLCIIQPEDVRLLPLSRLNTLSSKSIFRFSAIGRRPGDFVPIDILEQFRSKFCYQVPPCQPLKPEIGGMFSGEATMAVVEEVD
jgi:hypothetical protein